jgi:hypothetical protein
VVGRGFRRARWKLTPSPNDRLERDLPKAAAFDATKAKIDPDNWPCGCSRRLEAEALRDAILAVSGT